MSYDYPAYPPLLPPAQAPIITPSAPPIEAEENTHEAARLHKSFSITCIALGALSMVAGATIGSPFIFGAGVVLGIVGLISLAPNSSIHISSNYPCTVVIPPYAEPSPIIFHLPLPSRRPKPVFVTHSPPPPQTTPQYQSRHIPVGGGGTIFTRPGNRIQVGR